MTIEQTVEIPADHRLIIDVPKEVPAGRAQVIIKFPVKEGGQTEESDNSWFENGEECPICAKYRDPVTGELRFNTETMAGLQEVKDMIAGKIPNTLKSFSSLNEMLADLDSDD